MLVLPVAPQPRSPTLVGAHHLPPGPARDKALGVYGAMGALGAVVGLLLGGVLTEYLSWRWILLVNLPIALAVLAGTSVLVEGDREHGGIDMPGAITATLGLGALVYAINRANQDGWTGSARTSSCSSWAPACLPPSTSSPSTCRW